MLSRQREVPLQRLPEQQAWPTLPQAPQRLVPRHPRPTLQLLPEQHSSPEPPHDEQVLDAHASPGLQALPEQHRWVLPPQGPHVPPLHASDAVLQVLPAQHACPELPQRDTWQEPERQARPAPQVVPPQQVWPAAPHAWQRVPRDEHW